MKRLWLLLLVCFLFGLPLAMLWYMKMVLVVLCCGAFLQSIASAAQPCTDTAALPPPQFAGNILMAQLFVDRVQVGGMGGWVGGRQPHSSQSHETRLPAHPTPPTHPALHLPSSFPAAQASACRFFHMKMRRMEPKKMSVLITWLAIALAPLRFRRGRAPPPPAASPPPCCCRMRSMTNILTVGSLACPVCVVDGCDGVYGQYHII